MTGKTALLTLDLQKGIFGFAASSEAVVPFAAKAVEAARKKQIPILHIGLGFEPGHPEIGDSETRFLQIKQNGMFIKGSESSQFHPSLTHPEDIIVYKQRFSAFSENSLHMILRAKHIEHLVLMGISTSGIVLSTLRRAYDLDFRCTVIKDACFDRDEEMHRVLTEKVFPVQATVITAKEFEASI